MREITPEDLRFLTDQWMEQARQEAEKLAPKVVEYGALDLEMMGEGLRATSSHPDAFSGAAAQELAIAFYVLGKVARLISAYSAGRLPSDDTWVDLSIYSRMALTVRRHGAWPPVAPAPGSAKPSETGEKHPGKSR